MLKFNTTAVAVTCILVLFGSSALAEDATPTNTRRPTPVPTATRTETSVAATPTAPISGSNVYLCSRGGNDGAQCLVDDDCPGGACVLSQGICDGGSEDSDYCNSADDCTGGL